MRLGVGSGIAALLIIVTSAELSGGPSATLNGIRYGIRGQVSSLRLLVGGMPAYAVERGRDGVAILMKDTRVGSPPGAARLAFDSGGIRQVSVTRLPGDAARVDVRFRGRAECSVSRFEGGLVLSVTRPSAAREPVPASTAPGMPRKDATLVDVPGMAFSEARGGVPAPSLLDDDSEPRPAPVVAARVSASPLAVAAGISALGTVVVLLTLRLGLRLLPETGDAASANEEAKDDVERKADEQEPDLARERDGQTLDNDDAGATRPDDELTRLDESRRPEYESLRLHDTMWSSNLATKARAISASSLSAAGIVSEARRLGVGNGEIQLAASLQRYERSVRRKEQGR